jgi:PAS domain S-box-containing protein
MNELVIFSLILLTLLRIIGLVISIDFYLKMKRERFRLFFLGWFVWIIGGILPIISSIIENELISQSLLIINAVLVSLGALFIIMGVNFYFKRISIRAQLFSVALIPSVYVILSFIIGFYPAGRIILAFFVLISIILFSAGLINRKTLREYIGGSIFWFYTTFLFFASLLIVLVFDMLNGYSYGLYDSNDVPVIILNYFLGIGFTLFLIVLFIHSEHSLSSKELKRSEKMFDESEKRYRSLITNIPAVTWISDKKGRTIFISPNVEEIYGYTPKEIYKGGSELWFGRIHPNDVGSVTDAYNSLFKGHASFDIEYRIRRKDGQWIWLHDKCIVVYEKDDELYSYGVFTEVTEHKCIERELQESEERYRTLFESTPVAVLITDLEGIILAFNKQLAKQTGYTNEELYSINTLSFYAKQTDRTALMERLSKDGQVRDYELEIKQKDGTMRHALLNIDAIDIQGEKLLLTTALDITDRKEAEILKNELADVQSMSLIEAGSFEIVMSNLRFCDFLDNFFVPYFDLLGNSFEYHSCNDGTVTIQGDADRLQQALDNIMVNAIKQTNKDTRKITAKVNILLDSIEIVISDNGVGIELANLEKIFEKFVSIQTEVSVTGTGIGLFLTREIINVHGGTVCAESKGMGHGATFIITLPKL